MKLDFYCHPSSNYTTPSICSVIKRKFWIFIIGFRWCLCGMQAAVKCLYIYMKQIFHSVKQLFFFFFLKENVLKLYICLYSVCSISHGNFTVWISVCYDRKYMKWWFAVIASKHTVLSIFLLNMQCFLWWDVREAELVLWFPNVESTMWTALEKAIFGTVN